MAALLGLEARLSKPPIVTTIVVPREHVLYKTLTINGIVKEGDLS